MTSCLDTGAVLLDSQALLVALKPCRMEMGTRDFKRTGTDSLSFKVGFGGSTSWVETRINGSDLYDVVIFKLRSGKRTVLGTVSDAYGEDLARLLIAEWCAICTRKGY